MHEFVTSARDAKEVAVEIYGDGAPQRFPMARDEKGKWRVELPVGAGTKYKYVLDGEAWPDPLSRYQPEGVHGPSQLVDLAFDWAPFQAPALADSVIYELHVGTFTPEGTFDAVKEKIAYIKEMGFNRVQLMPVGEFSGNRNWGYDGAYWNAPSHSYGTPREFQEMINEFHKNGIAVQLDVVYNHLGAEGNYTNKFLPMSKATRNDWGDDLNFDEAGSDEVNRIVHDNALLWTRDYNLDGLRLDAAENIQWDAALAKKNNQQNDLHTVALITETAHKLAEETGRYIIVTAEIHNNTPNYITPVAKGGMGVDAQYSANFRYAVNGLLHTDTHPDPNLQDFGQVGHLAKAFTHNTIVIDGVHSIHHGGIHGAKFPDAVPQQMIVHYQSHDDVGNRPESDRINDFDGAKIAAAMVLLSPFVPFTFMGEEYFEQKPFPFFTNHSDPEVADATVKGRTAFIVKERHCDPDVVTDCQSEQAFQDAKLDWSKLDLKKNNAMGQWFRTLISLRKEMKLGHSQGVTVQYNEDQRWLIVDNGGVTMAVNFSSDPQSIPMNMSDRNVVLSSKHDYLTDPEVGILVPERSVVVLKADKMPMLDANSLVSGTGSEEVYAAAGQLRSENRLVTSPTLLENDQS